MVVVLATIVVSYLVEGTLVGLAAAALERRFGWRFSRWKGTILIVLAFVFLDTYWLPAVISLDARVTIGNSYITSMFGLGHQPIALSELYGPSMFDLVVWAFKVLVAGFVMDRVR